MFRLYDEFRSFDENRQPYSLTAERHTETANLHAGVTEMGFSLKSVGNRHILNSPPFVSGELSFCFRINYMQEIAPEFSVLFGYDTEKRRGSGIRVHYDLAGALTVSLIETEKSLVTVREERRFDDVCWNEEESIPFSLTAEPGGVVCRVSGLEAAFSCNVQPGYMAIERAAFIGELILNGLCLEIRDELPERELLPPVTVQIPLINGGDIPYRVTWELLEIGGRNYLKASLDGGTKTRPVNREERKGQYVAEKDVMVSPYVGIGTDGKEHIFMLSPGENRFIDPNIFWECQKGFFGDVPLPLSGLFSLPEIGDDCTLIFGYERLSCSGYNCQAGGREFRFDKNGGLLYSGARTDGRDSWEIVSPPDKFALSLIPADAWHRDEIVEHLKGNHYFERREKPSFELIFHTLTDTDYLSVSAVITDAFGRKELRTGAAAVTVGKWMKGYAELRAKAEFSSLPVGVYRILFRLSYGDTPYADASCVFEVFDRDTDENPALKTGLPFTFSMPNEQKWLMRNSFDLWNPMPSCDVEHFITCVTDTPIEAEKRRTWEVIKPFKREWFAWLAKRTANDFTSARHDIVRQKADYLFSGIDDGTDDWLGSGSCFPFRSDFWEYSRINNSFQRELLKDFIRRSEKAENIIGKALQEKKIPYDVFRSFMEACGGDWVTYVNDRVLELFRRQNEELKKANPAVRRSFYGPFNAYVMPTMTYRTIRSFGLPLSKALTEDIYTGFMVFEDYPYSCAYQTYRGAFGMMTLCLHFPGARIYPEQYKGSPGGCIDGAVKYAHAPMGAYSVEPYQNSTHAFEYVFNTACRTEDGWRYWDNYGFHRSDVTDDFMNRLIRDWYYAVEYRPERPLRSMAFAADFDDADEVFSETVTEKRRKYAMYNRSETAFGLLHECSREAGLPNGFAVLRRTLGKLTASDCDVLVLPSLASASDREKAEIRRLYDEGVNLIGMFDVSGLEDLFGVRKEAREADICTVEYGGEKESVYGRHARFAYAPDTARVVLTADGELPAILSGERTLLINTDIENLGSEDTAKTNASNAYHIVGRLLRACLEAETKRLSRPMAKGENVGVTLFRTAKGKMVLLAIDYTPFDNAERAEKQAVVRLELPQITRAVSDEKLWIGKKNGVIRELRFAIRPHGFVFIELS